MSQHNLSLSNSKIKSIILCAVLAFVLLNSTLFSVPSPLVISLCIFAPLYCLPVIISASSAYFLIFSLNGYTACILLTSLLTVFLRYKLKKLPPHRLGVIGGGILSLLLAAYGLIFDQSVSGWLTSAVLLISFTYLLSYSKACQLNIPHLAAYVILLSSLSGIDLPLDLGCILASFSILHVSKLNDISKSAIFSSLSSAALLMAHPNQIYRALFICVAGMLLSLVPSDTRLRRPLYLICTALLYSIFNLSYSNDFLLSLDVFIGASAFVFTFDALGDRLFRKVTDLLCRHIDEKHISSTYAYELALSKIQASLADSSAFSAAPTKPRSSTVAYSRVCASCRKHSHCYTDKLIDLTQLDVSKELSPLLDECIRREDIFTAVSEANSRYDYITDKQSDCRSACTKISELISLANSIISGANACKSADMILSKELTGRLSLNLSSELYSEVYGDGSAVVRIPNDMYMNTERIAKSLKDITGKAYIPQHTVKQNSLTYISFYPCTAYQAKAYTSSFSAVEGEPSGDVFTSCTYNEKEYFILSDGMGTGEQAFLSSKRLTETLTQLLCAGLDVESSIKLSSVALKYSDIDESFATLDILSVDRNSGACCIFKAGAGDSYILGEDFKISSGGGYPIGIFDKCIITREVFDLSACGEVILSSDGAELTPNSVRSAVANSSSTEELCDMLLRENNTNSHEKDDSFVAVIKLYKNC